MTGKGGKKTKTVQRKPDDQVPKYKITQLREVVELAKNNKVIGIARWTSIPSAQLQQMRQSMGHDIHMKVVRNRILYLGLKEALGTKPIVDELLGNMEGQSAIVATNMNPFKLFKKLESTKTKAPARGGEIAPEDIIVQAGETDFKPGPIVGELGKAGIPASIEGGKVVIKVNKTVVKAGEKIPKASAIMLGRLGVHPLTVGLDLRAVLEEGMVYKREVLAVDEGMIMGQIMSSSSSAFNLAMFVAYPTKFTIKPLVTKAYMNAMGVAMEAAILNKKSVGPLLAKASAHAAYIKHLMDMKTDAAKPRDAISGEVLDKKVDKKPDKKDDQSTAAAGLGSLFGEG